MEMDKQFKKVDKEYENCIKICRLFYKEINPELLNQSCFNLSPNLVTRINYIIFSF
jgi:hypothetical protein